MECLHNRLYTPAEAAEILSVSTDTVYSWIRTGELPAARLSPAATRISGKDLMDFYEAHKRKE